MSSWDKIVSLLENHYDAFLQGLLSTLILAIVGTVVGLILGILLALLRNIKIKETDNLFIRIIKKIITILSSIYINFFRGTPMMVQAMIIFFGSQLIGINWSSIVGYSIFNGTFLCGLFVITINTAAYMAEIIRSGMNAIDDGQLEASRSLGMSYPKAIIKVIMPQAIKNSLPTILNEYIINVKDSSVLNVIGLTELYASVSIATNKNYFKVEGYIIIAIIYLILTLLSSLLLKLVENKLNGKKMKKIELFRHYKPKEVLEVL